ncbi:TrkH family potassium uptake protein [Amnibacterium setariae]|uniref:TrkH family potassium uptake protein n=1 Tax=Amnibacterium setariae TaxID=2306585 RepID=A0A3A1TXL2_9MICO|nr:potassium transporter TrkG [Amnibacterium setariae]RIX26449.1 TrkH family potassium uptake protein [Amnibacterium setariae]
MPVRSATPRRWGPATTVLIGYAAAVGSGFALLSLPVAKAGPGAAAPLDALFTSISAVSVTGLVTVGTAEHWTVFGQAVILLLVQVGGLGIMTLASLIGLAVARKLSLGSKLTTSAETQGVGIADVRRFITGAIAVSLAVEAIGALLLTAWFATAGGFPPARSLWYGVFHAVSAFNNAGFTILPRGLIPFVGDPVVCLVLSALVLIGSLGFPVLDELRRFPRTPLRWSMNTRLVLWGTAVLTVTGTVFITAVEWARAATFGPLDWPVKLLAGFFQAAQTRSGGFATVDVGRLDGATLIVMDVLMFIGGGPAGTAGGIKLTTFGVLFFILVAEMRGRTAVNVFGKRLSRAVHRQAITVSLVAVGAIVASTIALALLSDEPVDRLAFEAVSAFATAGLSTGLTGDLPPAAQGLLLLLMFAGRLGPILLASALAVRVRPLTYEFPKERPIIG